jgi:hypothetical protein
MRNKLFTALIIVTIVFSFSACSESNYSSEDQDTYTTPVTEDETTAPQPVPEQTSALPDGVIDWSDAKQHVGENAVIYGTVQSVKYASSSNGSPTFLNIGVDYPNENRVSVIIWDKNRGNFSPSPESLYSGQEVYVSGYIDTYNGVVEIEVSNPSQIEVGNYNISSSKEDSTQNDNWSGFNQQDLYDQQDYYYEQEQDYYDDQDYYDHFTDY